MKNLGEDRKDRKTGGEEASLLDQLSKIPGHTTLTGQAIKRGAYMSGERTACKRANGGWGGANCRLNRGHCGKRGEA